MVIEGWQVLTSTDGNFNVELVGPNGSAVMVSIPPVICTQLARALDPQGARYQAQAPRTEVVLPWWKRWLRKLTG